MWMALLFGMHEIVHVNWADTVPTVRSGKFTLLAMGQCGTHKTFVSKKLI